MKNKSWLKIAQTLDLNGRPVTDANSYMRDYKRVFAQAANSVPGQSGYAISFAMNASISMANSVYLSINEFLSAPYKMDLKDFLAKYNNMVTPGGIGVYRLMLSGVPMSQVQNISVTSGSSGGSGGSGSTGPDGNLIGINVQENLDFTCLQQSHLYTPKYVRKSAEFWSTVIKYYFGENIQDPQHTGEAIDPLDDMKQVVHNIALVLGYMEAFLRVCCCGAFKDCGYTGDNPPPNFKCALGDKLVDQDNALGRQTPIKFTQLVIDKAGNEDTGVSEGGAVGSHKCGDIMTEIQNVLFNDGQQGWGKAQYFFTKLNNLYQVTMQSSTDWNVQGLRVNTLTTFMLFVYTLCQVAIKVKEMWTGYASMDKSLGESIEDQIKDAKTQCNTIKSLHLICAWLVHVFGPNADQQQSVKGLPSYIIANYENVRQCAADMAQCRPTDTWAYNFDWNDIGLPLTLPRQ